MVWYYGQLNYSAPNGKICFEKLDFVLSRHSVKTKLSLPDK